MNKRFSNFKLLRIVAMLMVVAHHFSAHGQFNYLTTDISINRLWIQGGMWASISGKRCLLMAVCTIGLTFLSVIIFDMLGLKYSFFRNCTPFFYSMKSLPILLTSFLLFLGFEKMKIGYHKFINVISSATFGVYLIHDHAFNRIVLWENVFKNAAFADAIYLIPYSIFVIMLVFAVCTLLELIRIYVLEKRYIKFIDRMAFYLDGALDRIFVFTLGMKG